MTTKADAIGKTDYDFLPPQVADQHRLNDREVIETCAAHDHEEVVESGEGVRTFISATFPVYESAGTVFGVGGISTDITQQKLTEEALQRSHSELEEALNRERVFSLLLQRALLPSAPAAGPGYEVAVEYLPAFASREIGGDFYDVFQVADGGAGVLIGDVAGKGLEAAAMAAATRSTIHAFVHETASPAEALARANSVLFSRQDESDSFATVFLAIIDPAAGEISYANAGHPPAFICRSDGTAELLELGQMPLAIVEAQTFEEHRTPFERGDKLVLYTDGISEAHHGPKLLGLGGVERILSERPGMSPAELAHALVTAATDWADGKLSDDAAVVVLEKTGR